MRTRLVSALALGIIACVYSATSSAAGTKKGSGTKKVSGTVTVSDQLTSGAKLYAEHCANCHGDRGQGTKKGPAVVGPSALTLEPPAKAKKRKMQFHTAADVYTFVKKSMPKDDPGSLSDDEYAAILAFDLKANGVTLTQPLTPASAQSITLHP